MPHKGGDGVAHQGGEESAGRKKKHKQTNKSPGDAEGAKPGLHGMRTPQMIWSAM
jgi:hypothetical protein